MVSSVYPYMIIDQPINKQQTHEINLRFKNKTFIHRR